MAVSSVRRVVVRTTVGSLATAALLGIAALISPGRFGGLQQRVLLTTLITGITSVLTLCYLATADLRSRWLGVIGGVSAVVAAVCALDMFWGHWQEDPGLALLRTFGVAGILALTLAQFSLLLAVVRRPGAIVRLQQATLVAGTLLAGLLAATVLGWRPNDTQIRLVGVDAILDVLGTLVTIALGMFGAGRRLPETRLVVELPAPLAERARARAAASGQDPVDLVLHVLDQNLDPDAGAEPSVSSGSGPKVIGAGDVRP